LQSIFLGLEGLKEHAKLEKKHKELLDIALRECYRAKDLIHNPREFHRPSSGKKTWMDLHESLDSILLLQKKDFNDKQISVVREGVARNTGGY